MYLGKIRKFLQEFVIYFLESSGGDKRSPQNMGITGQTGSLPARRRGTDFAKGPLLSASVCPRLGLAQNERQMTHFILDLVRMRHG